MKNDKQTIVKKLLDGMYLLKRNNHNNVPGYKMYSGNMVPDSFIPEKLISSLEKTSPYCLFKTDSNQKLTLHLSNIRRLHGNHWLKKAYKKHTLTKMDGK